MPVADYTLGEALLTILWVFLFVAWIMVLFSIIGDLFRDHALSGWAKAIWILFLIFVPFVTALVYLIVRGEGMRERSVREQAEARKHLESYIRETAGSSQVDELHKLSELRDKGAITDEEFQRMKAKLVG